MHHKNPEKLGGERTMLRSHLIAVSIAVAVAMPAMAGPKD